MGVTNFKTSIHHKVQSGHKVFNILNDPVIATVSPRIECTWEGGSPPKWSKSYAKKIKDLAEKEEDNPMNLMNGSNAFLKDSRKSRSLGKQEKRSRSMKKNAKKSRQHHELKLNLSPTRKKSSAKKPRSLEH